MRFAFILIHFLLSFLLVTSCAHKSSRPSQVHLSKAQVEQMNREALSIASERLGKMVEEVGAKNNPAQKNYLATDLFLKGNMALMEGDYMTASVLFEHLTRLVPEDQFLQKKYAISLIRINDMEKSQVVLEKLFANSSDEKVGLILAGVYTGLDQEEKAREIYQQILRKNAKSEDACIFLSKSYALGDQNKEAFSLLKQCSQKDPKNGMYDYYLGKIHLDAGKHELAKAAFKRAHERQSSLGQAVNALGVMYEEEEKFDEALNLYTRHLKKKPSDTTILARIVHVLFLKEKFNEVIPYAEKLSDLEPDNLNLKVKLGILYTDAKKYDQAVSVFKDLLAAAPQSDKILYYLAAIYQETKDWQNSIEHFNQIPTSSGLYSDSAIQMANILSHLAQEEFHSKMEQETWKEAFLKHVNHKIEELKDLRVEFSVIKAGYFEGIGEYRAATDALMVVQNEQGFSVQHKYYLANLFEREKRFAESTAVIMGILEKEPKNAHAWNFLGYSLVVRGEEMDRAYEYIQKARQISPEDGYIRDSLGWYYYKKGEVKKALAELELAVKKVPDDVEILKHLAIIHQDMKQFSKARSFLESALKHARYLHDRREILSQMKALENARIPASGNID